MNQTSKIIAATLIVSTFSIHAADEKSAHKPYHRLHMDEAELRAFKFSQQDLKAADDRRTLIKTAAATLAVGKGLEYFAADQRVKNVGTALKWGSGAYLLWTNRGSIDAIVMTTSEERRARDRAFVDAQNAQFIENLTKNPAALKKAGLAVAPKDNEESV